MKRWLLALVIFIILLSTALVYGLIPKKIIVSSSLYIHANASAVSRSLVNNNDWKKWWPSKGGNFSDSGFSHNQYTFKIREKFYHAVRILIQTEGMSRESRINIFPVTKDSLYLFWKYEFQASLNPFSRFYEYRQAVNTKKEMDNILLSMKSFLVNKENVYGIKISQIMSRDSTLITTKFRTNDYPTTAEIYEAIYKLKDFAALNHARENNFPMKQTEKLKEGGYETMVAIPINKALANKGKFILKRYVPWKEMMGQVTGGDSTISRGFQHFKIFLQEYQYMQMTTPFESLVTDRSIEKDSSKWVTRFICPIP